MTRFENIDWFNAAKIITKSGNYTVKGQDCFLPFDFEKYSEATIIPAETVKNWCAEQSETTIDSHKHCDYSVVNQDSFSAAMVMAKSDIYQKDKDAKEILVLNFANSIHPGGGVERGARAQEEDLCRRSTLYASLTGKSAATFYAGHKQNYTPLASDAMILSPTVSIFYDEKGQLLPESVHVAVLTCAAPNIRNGMPTDQKTYEKLLLNRITGILQAAAHYHYQYLVLGAWGCGAFGNDAVLVSDLFDRALKDFRYHSHTEKDIFRKIAFAVLDHSKNQYNFKAFQKNFKCFYRDTDNMCTPQQILKSKTYQDKIRGSLLGGAIGDALGYPVEFLSWKRIQNRYGDDGITRYHLDCETGAAVFSDDTQMSLYTANGILVAETSGRLKDTHPSITNNVGKAYQDWLKTQTTRYGTERQKIAWLNDIPDLFHRRAPGNTCIRALKNKKTVQNSKGCGGVMRVAPLAMAKYPESRADLLELDREGAALAALTHGHPLGWIPAAMLTHIVNMGIYKQPCTIREAVEDAMQAVSEIYRSSDLEDALAEMNRLILLAVELSEKPAESADAIAEDIHQIGGGWTAEETLAIAVYCCLRFPDDFSKAIIASVNHSGDSDSTGAVTGNILGAWMGYEAIDDQWKRNLEMRSILLEMADDLWQMSRLTAANIANDPIWICKYVYGHYAESKEVAKKRIDALKMK